MGKKNEKIHVSNSSFAEGWIHLDGKPFRFNEPSKKQFRPYLYPIYDIDHRHTLLMFARQCEKSTTIANRIVTRCCLNTYHKTLYVTPTQMQTRVFVDDKLDPALNSPEIKMCFKNSSKLTDKIEEKELSNGSKIFLRYAFLSADRTRGITAKDIQIDEIQDIITDNIPIIEECASHYPVEKRLMYSGTPKTFDSAIEFFWQRSSQCEWGIKCSGCNCWNVLGVDNIGKTGPICSKCGKIINPSEGQWISMNSNASIKAFRVTQLMVPWVYTEVEGWNDILAKMDKYPYGKFMNEVMASAYDYGVKPLSITDIKSCCDESLIWANGPVISSFHPIFAGIDIGTGEGDYPSYTVLSIIQMMPNNKYRVLYIKRYDGSEIDASFQLKDIIQKCVQFRVSLIGIDWGMSWMFRTELRKAFPPNKVVTFEYSHNLYAKFKWNKNAMTFVCNRTENMTELIQRIKKKLIVFPSFDLMEPFYEDIISITTETDRRGGLIYNHPVTQPDDVFHSILYAFMASDIFHNRRKYIQGPDVFDSGSSEAFIS